MKPEAKKRVGFATIGQSPRVDVMLDIEPILGTEITGIERGALDGLGIDDIRRLGPEAGETSLITRLRDGSSVVVGKKKILPFLQETIRKIENKPVDLVALLCTDEFPGLESHRILILPSRLLLSEVASIAKSGRIGIFVPLEEQRAMTIRKWEKTGLSLVIEVLNPYQSELETHLRIRRMKKQAAELVVLDCIGYSSKTQAALEREMGRPVLLPRTVLARAIKKWLGNRSYTG
jgi:protein AroM